MKRELVLLELTDSSKMFEPYRHMGIRMDMSNRIKYDDKRGMWKVIWKDKDCKQEFKTSGEAMQHLRDLHDKKKTAEY